ncbi:MAG: hypothetical protein LN415_08855 [Candidatus Thermoplasmatota archaeon]|nr:hypothetical protein [Candidatus Thermoplasmatota archaeon]
MSTAAVTIKSRILSRKTTYCFLAVLVLVNLIYRYPIGITHEVGADTTFIHSLANSLSQEGHAKWVLNPLSFFGLYALSYPSAAPFLISVISEMAGMSIELTILILGTLFGVIGSVSSFLVAREIIKDERYAFVVALLFSLAPFFLKDTTWVGSSRGFVVAFLPVIALLLLKQLRSGDSRYLVLAICAFVFICSMHRMGFLGVFLFIAFGFIPSLHRITQKIRFALVKYEKVFRAMAVLVALLGFFLLFYVQILFPGYGGFDIREEYRLGTFFEGESVPVLLLNMGVNFTGKVGLLAPLTIIGLVMYTWKRPKEVHQKYILMLVFILIPFLSLRDYISEFMILFFVFLIAFAMVYPPLVLRKGGKMIGVLAIILLVASAGFSWEMKDYWRHKYRTDDQISEDTYDAAIYIKSRTTGIIATNDGLIGGSAVAISGRGALPFGGASTHWYSAQQLIFGTERYENLLFFPASDLEVRRLDYDEITFNTDEIITATNAPNALIDWESIFYNPPSSAIVDEEVEKYSIHYIFVNSRMPNHFFSYVLRPSPFLVGMQHGENARYRVFENENHALWYYN